MKRLFYFAKIKSLVAHVILEAQNMLWKYLK